MTKARDIASAAPAPSTVSATELGYLDGVSSAIQTQIDGKQAANANVSTTELGYLDGVTSAIQTQLDGKTAKNTLTTTGDIYYASSANTPARLGIGSTGNVLTVASGVPSWAAPAASGMTLVSEVAVSNSASTNVNDVFSSTYKNYRIMIVSTGSNSGSLTLRLRVSGTDTSSSYDTQEVYSSSTSVTGRSNVFGTDEWYIGDFGSADGLISFDISSPNLADDTNFVSQSFFTGMLRITGGSQSSATQFTGFTALYSANFTGSIFIYGYAKA